MLVLVIVFFHLEIFFKATIKVLGFLCWFWGFLLLCWFFIKILAPVNISVCIYLYLYLTDTSC